MTYGLKDDQWALIEKLLIHPLQSQKKLWVFGSRARGDHREFSDLDILIEGANDFPKGLMPEIQEALEESNLPIRVDLVFEEELATSYRDSAMAERILIETT